MNIPTFLPQYHGFSKSLVNVGDLWIEMPSNWIVVAQCFSCFPS